MSVAPSNPRGDLPHSVAEVVDIMATYRGFWALCGGWAVDAWLGRQTREHGDVDIVVFADELDILYEHLEGWHLVAHEDDFPERHAEAWRGRPLAVPSHIHGKRGDGTRLPDVLPSPVVWGYPLDVQVNEREDGHWLCRRQPRVALPLERSVSESGWGLPTEAPELLLYYKAAEPRPHDEQDFDATLPLLSADQRRWLREAVAAVYPEHSWLHRL